MSDLANVAKRRLAAMGTVRIEGEDEPISCSEGVGSFSALKTMGSISSIVVAAMLVAQRAGLRPSKAMPVR